jgi:hypothetical protein
MPPWRRLQRRPRCRTRVFRAQFVVSRFHKSPFVTSDGTKHLQMATEPCAGALQLQRVPEGAGFAIIPTRNRIPSPPTASRAAISNRATALDSRKPTLRMPIPLARAVAGRRCVCGPFVHVFVIPDCPPLLRLRRELQTIREASRFGRTLPWPWAGGNPQGAR